MRKLNKTLNGTYGILKNKFYSGFKVSKLRSSNAANKKFKGEFKGKINTFSLYRSH